MKKTILHGVLVTGGGGGEIKKVLLSLYFLSVKFRASKEEFSTC
jgi:hypothetical protein